MSIQERKLFLIETLLSIGDTQLLEKVEAFFKDEVRGVGRRMTIEEYRSQIETSLSDAREGRVMTQQQLKKEIARWGKN